MTEQWNRLTAGMTPEQSERLAQGLAEAARHAQRAVEEYGRVMSKAGQQLAAGIEKYLESKGQ